MFENNKKYLNELKEKVIFSRAFRKLGRKTQVFISGYNDIVRTRLTHTLEVVEIALKLAKKIKDELPESFDDFLEKIELIALCHDIGHTPFGHVGERTLNQIMNNCVFEPYLLNLENEETGFKHNWQSLKLFHNIAKDQKTIKKNDYNEILYGILNHSSTSFKSCVRCDFHKAFTKTEKESPVKLCQNNGVFSVGHYKRFLCTALGLKSLSDEFISIESIIVAAADRFAQIHHDLEDGLTMKMINLGDLMSFLYEQYNDLKIHSKIIETCFSDDDYKSLYRVRTNDKVARIKNTIQLYQEDKSIVNAILGSKCLSQKQVSILSFFALEKLTNDFISRFKQLIGNKLQYIEKRTNEYNKVIVDLHNEFIDKYKDVETYLQDIILNSHFIQTMDSKCKNILIKLFKFYAYSPKQLPDEVILEFFGNCYDDIKKDIQKDSSNGIALNLVIRKNLNKINFSNPKHKSILARAICDHIAGMTDDEAKFQYNIFTDSTSTL